MQEEVAVFFNGKRCLVTGGTGMIGRQVVKRLCDAGAEVTSVSLDDLKPDVCCVYIKADLTDFCEAKKVTWGMDCVFHIAGIKGSPKMTLEKPASFMVAPLMFNTNIFEAARQNDVKHLVFTSSIGAYSGDYKILREEYDRWGDVPMDKHPGYVKRMGELTLDAFKLEYGLDWSCVRLANTFGPGDCFDPDNAMFIPSLMAKIDRGDDPVVVWGDGTPVRDFVYSEDVARGILYALCYGTNGFVNIGSGNGFSVRHVVETMRDIVPFNYVFDATYPRGHERRVMSIAKAKEQMRWQPEVSLEDGLRKTWEWFRHNREEHLKRQNYFAGGAG